MSKLFFISDHHFGHENVYKFRDRLTDERIRPWAKDATEGDRMLIQLWNSTVKPKDTVYHLGDFCMNIKRIEIAKQLNGRKILIRGNHDHGNVQTYLEYFEEVFGVLYKYGMVLSHFPIHPGSLNFRQKVNLHGHTHSYSVLKTVRGKEVIDPRYVNVSVESEVHHWLSIHPGTPITLEQINAYLTRDQ